MTIETKELVISEELKRKVEMICRFVMLTMNLLMTILNLLKIQILLMLNHIY